MLINLDKQMSENIYHIARQEMRNTRSPELCKMWKTLCDNIKDGYERDFNQKLV